MSKSEEIRVNMSVTKSFVKYQVVDEDFKEGPFGKIYLPKGTKAKKIILIVEEDEEDEEEKPSKKKSLKNKITKKSKLR